MLDLRPEADDARREATRNDAEAETARLRAERARRDGER